MNRVPFFIRHRFLLGVTERYDKAKACLEQAKRVFNYNQTRLATVVASLDEVRRLDGVHNPNPRSGMALRTM
jgi:hypothetical protein